MTWVVGQWGQPSLSESQYSLFRRLHTEINIVIPLLTGMDVSMCVCVCIYVSVCVYVCVCEWVYETMYDRV